MTTTTTTTDNRKLRPVPIGTGATGTRVESDSMGEIEVPADRYWGAQTQRSLIHFSIGDDRMPKAVYHAYGYVKKAAALVNAAAGRLGRAGRRRPSSRAADEAIAGKLDASSRSTSGRPGSGTQSNMNVNEVIVQPRHPAARRRAREQDAGPPERRRQHGAVVQRHLPDRDAHRRRAGDLRAPAAAGRGAGRRDRGARRRVGGRRQDRPHAPGGRGAADGRAGVVGLCAQLRDALGTGSDGLRGGSVRAGRRRHRRRHRAERAAEASARRSPPRSPS